MTTSAVIFIDNQPHALGVPDATVSASDAAQLRALPGQVNEALENDFCFAVGLLPYDAGHWLQDLPEHNPSTVVVHLYRQPPQPGLPLSSTPFRLTAPFQPAQQKRDYLASLARVRDYLLAGDCYQVNLTQRFSARFQGSPLTAWLSLLAAHPAPHACYFDSGHEVVFGVSPERFLSLHNGQLITQPIKGSRPRGATPADDLALGEGLQHNPKDRAENLMIVDLLRNDLGALCTPGSVHAEPLFALHKFSNVQHLISTIRGTLRPEVLPLDALLSAFPGGSITGAPKRRAMEIIAELEPLPRGPYCGSLFWLDNQGRMDSNILIRTLHTDGDQLHCHGGGGIVFDSVAEEEYLESVFKIEKLMEAIAHPQ